jgi:hypothetical protein
MNNRAGGTGGMLQDKTKVLGEKNCLSAHLFTKNPTQTGWVCSCKECFFEPIYTTL